MTVNSDSTSRISGTANQWYASAVSTAIVGAIFSLIMLVLLVSNFIHSSIVQARREQELVNQKIEIQKRPDDEQLLTQIRRLDLQYRQNLIRELDFTRKGAYLLLGNVVITLIGIKGASVLKKKMPIPQPAADRLTEQVRQAKFSRFAVTAGIVVLGLGALLLAVRPEIAFFETTQVDTSIPSPEQINKNWPRFRGPEGLGRSAYTNVPDHWDGKTGEGILWKTEVPLTGMNSPVVWEDRVFLSGGDPNSLEVYCFDASNGRLLWTGNVRQLSLKEGEEPLDVMEDTGYAAPTVATDGRRVYAIFATGVVGSFDFDGNKIWEKDLGIPDNMYGYASSLAMFENVLLIQYDQGTVEDGKSAFIALESFSGRRIWDMKRPVGSSWTSPIVVQIDNQYQLVTCSNPWIIAYNPADGTELWRANCLGADVAPSPIYAGGLVFAVEPHMKTVAIRPDGHGDVTETNIAYKIDFAPDICSPVGNSEKIFLLSSDGLLCCYKTEDGTKLWEKELREYFQASPSLVGNKLYLLSEEGVMFIVEAGPEYKEAAKCELGEKSFASPAFADGRIYIRGVKNLYCIGSQN
jgi:outer membrane protein assembly factor BamB